MHLSTVTLTPFPNTQISVTAAKGNEREKSACDTNIKQSDWQIAAVLTGSPSRDGHLTQTAEWREN